MNHAHPCHVCRSVDRKVMRRQEFSGLSSGTLMSAYDVCVCQTCGFVFADDLPPEDAFDRYYAEMSKWEHLDNGGRESAEDAARFQATAEWVCQFGDWARHGALDVGCSTGGLLAALRRQGVSRLLGLDPSPQCARLASQHYGIEVVAGPVGRLPELPHDFGAVVLSGVLEHLVNPNQVLEHAWQRLSEQGIIYVSVPDAARFKDYMDAPYQQFSTEHIHFFTLHSLTNLLRQNGFEPLASRETAYPYTRGYQYPAVEVVCRKARPSSWTHDNDGEIAVETYIERSAAWQAKINGQIDELVRSQEPILVWGVGTNTQRLMATTALANANIVAFVDSNPHYHGALLNGHPVIAPNAVQQRGEKILVASIIFEREIVTQIRENLRCTNPLVTFQRP